MQRRYGTLDALRGVGALSVVVYHCTPGWLPQGYLAVDFFFALSGLVVAHAYRGNLASGAMPWRAFAARRVLRLYPLALLGVVLGAAHLALKWKVIPWNVDRPAQILASVGLNALLLPTLFGGDGSGRSLFPGNAVLWTLFLELLANLVWARWATKTSPLVIAVFVVASGLGLSFAVAAFGTANLGFNLSTLPGGLLRVSFGFGLGILMEQFPRPTRRPTATSAVALGAVLLGVYALPADALGGPVLIPVVSILVVTPLVLWIGSGIGTVGRLGDWLGEVSYPVYAVHLPIAELALSAMHRLSPGAPPTVSAVASILAAVAAGTVAYLAYDVPTRRLLASEARRRGWIAGRVRTEEAAPAE